MKRFKLHTTFIFISIFLTDAHASPLPCTIWQAKVRTHPVKKYKRFDGTEYTKTLRVEHCRDKFPTVIHWQDRFLDRGIKDWPEFTEKFKPWQHSEKELVLKSLSIQPQAFKNLRLQLIRGIQSKFPKNPGTAVKSLGAIAFYDAFFSSNEKDRILSHEFSHLYLHDLDPKKLADFIYEVGWRKKREDNSLIHLPDYPLLKSDSDTSVTEDIANHLEDFLYNKEDLIKRFPKRYEMIKGMLPSDFKLDKL